MEYKEQLELLRAQIPVGVRHAQVLLEKTGGSVPAARQLFETELCGIVTAKTGLLPEAALVLLVKHHYDIPQTLAAIEEERFTITERILRQSKQNKEDALQRIAVILTTNDSVKKDFWIALDALSHLNPYQYCLIVVCEWLNYADYEDFDHALYFHPEHFITQIAETLQLPLVAGYVRQAIQIRDRFFAQHAAEKPSLALYQQVGEEEEYRKQRSAFEAARPQITDRLYELVTTHISSFP